ncbi:MAG TPA: hypothetical protein VF494_06560 [Candidatus Limnocylindrales bacterium]
MFQLGFAETIQAEREREIAEMVRQRRLLEPDVDGRDPDQAAAKPAKPQPQRVRAQATRG